MRFPFFRRKKRLTARQRMILEHTLWLNRAVRRPQQYPRIPVRRVSEGGFAGLMTRPTGRRIAFDWWKTALERVT